MDHQTTPYRTPVNPLIEAFVRWTSGTGRGQRFGHWLGRALAVPELRHLTSDDVPWSPLQRPIREATVALVTTSGVHLRADQPFDLDGADCSFRVIPCTAEPGDLAISHRAYDRSDALRDPGIQRRAGQPVTPEPRLLLPQR